MAETKRTGGGHGRNHGYQRPKDMKGTFKKLMGYVGKYKGSLVLVAICLLISSAAGVATSYLLKPLLNDYIIPGDFPGLFKMLLVMGGMYLLSSLCSFAYARIMVHVAQHRWPPCGRTCSTGCSSCPSATMTATSPAT